MQIEDDPKFNLRYAPVRDAILVLSAHYKRRPGAPNPAIMVLVPQDHERAVTRLLDGFDVEVVPSLSMKVYGLRCEAVVVVGRHPEPYQRDVLARRTMEGPLLFFPW